VYMHTEKVINNSNSTLNFSSQSKGSNIGQQAGRLKLDFLEKYSLMMRNYLKSIMILFTTWKLRLCTDMDLRERGIMYIPKDSNI